MVIVAAEDATRRSQEPGTSSGSTLRPGEHLDQAIRGAGQVTGRLDGIVRSLSVVTQHAASPSEWPGPWRRWWAAPPGCPRRTWSSRSRSRVKRDGQGDDGGDRGGAGDQVDQGLDSSAFDLLQPVGDQLGARASIEAQARAAILRGEGALPLVDAGFLGPTAQAALLPGPLARSRPDPG